MNENFFKMYQRSISFFNQKSKNTSFPLPDTIRPVILISFGYIVGDISIQSATSDDDIPVLINDYYLNKTHEFCETSINFVSKPPEYITVVNASVYTFGNKEPLEMNIINILVDKIVGFSFIDIGK